MGIPGQLDAPDFLTALDQVVEACRRAKKVAGIFIAYPDRVPALVRRGFNFNVVGSDSSLLSAAAKAAASGQSDAVA
jgi:2-dehydro-3-deoxyglucarate aldolase/4-hydroxy-2-oxoheptanedioate aldolase